MPHQALLIWGGWEGHTPKRSVDVFAPWLQEQGYEVIVSDTLDTYEDHALMMSLDLIVPVWTMGTISTEQEKGLLSAVCSGVGFAGWHGGVIDSFRNNTEYQWMTGGQWVAHPGDCIPSYRVSIVDRKHEITRGIGDFELTNTEQYYMHVDPGNHILATTRFSGDHGDAGSYQAGTDMPFAWTKSWGKGRVFIAAWGHTYRDFDVPEARQIVQRGMLWANRE